MTFKGKFDKFVKNINISIQLKNKNALAILKSLEKARIIAFVNDKGNNKNSPSRFKGAITRDRALELTNEIKKSRDEWEERII